MDQVRLDAARAKLGSIDDVLKAHGKPRDLDPFFTDPVELEAALCGVSVEEIVDELVPNIEPADVRTSENGATSEEPKAEATNGHHVEAPEELVPHPADTYTPAPNRIGRFQDRKPGRVPPHDLEAEETVLGAMLIDADMARQLFDIISIEDFYRDAHRKIAEAVLELLKRDEPIDALRVYRVLVERGQHEAIGGAPYLHTLVAATPIVATAPYHAQTIVELARKRELIDIATTLAQNMYEETATADEAIASLNAHVDIVSRQTEAKIRLYTLAELRALPQPVDLIEGVVSRDVFCTLWGPSGDGKSLLALDMALSIACGRPWLGRGVSAGPVVMVVAEGASGTAARADAWLADRAVPEPGNLFVVPDAVNLFEEEDPQAFVRAVQSFGVEPALVVFDTLARSMVGADENSARDLGIVIAAADWIRSHSHATVLVVHHSGRKAEHERGSTALFAASDTVISAIKNEDDVVVVESRKQKDRADFEPFGLRIVPVDNSVVMVETSLSQSDEAPSKFAIQILTIATSSFGANRFSASGLIEEGGLQKRSVQRTLKWLVEQGFLDKEGSARSTTYAVTEKGESLFAP